MADRLHLSLWLRGYTPQNQLRHFATMLRKFPFSRLEPEFALRVYERERVEPALFERFYADANYFDAMMTDAEFYAAPNYGYEVDAHWDLWQWNKDWGLGPARVTLSSFGPEFDSPSGENLLIEFGLETQFLPPEGIPGNPYHYVRGNIQSLLKLTHDLDEALRPEKRLLWTDSAELAMGENFALRLERALEAGG
ncbi:MAG: hypothetical protein K2Q23_10360 [Bryobacteraceae bacterium]|nr:hypothetical protein [Bryobacteraceae bacterium]